MAIYSNGKTGEMTFTCEICTEEMSEEDHDYCDICPKCLEEW
jgi:Zn finger protein HypA/HybF involved in hydrogenase expression